MKCVKVIEYEASSWWECGMSIRRNFWVERGVGPPEPEPELCRPMVVMGDAASDV